MSQVKEKEAVEGQFGGLEHQQHPGHTPNWKMPRISNAYMLVYVRESEIPDINVDVSADDISQHLRRQLEKEQVTISANLCPRSRRICYAHDLGDLHARSRRIMIAGGEGAEEEGAISA